MQAWIIYWRLLLAKLVEIRHQVNILLALAAAILFSLL